MSDERTEVEPLVPVPPRWPTNYSLPPYVHNPCTCSPVEVTNLADLAAKRRVYIANVRDHNCPVHWSEAP